MSRRGRASDSYGYDDGYYGLDYGTDELPFEEDLHRAREQDRRRARAAAPRAAKPVYLSSRGEMPAERKARALSDEAERQARKKAMAAASRGGGPAPTKKARGGGKAATRAATPPADAAAVAAVVDAVLASEATGTPCNDALDDALAEHVPLAALAAVAAAARAALPAARAQATARRLVEDVRDEADPVTAFEDAVAEGVPLAARAAVAAAGRALLGIDLKGA